jgi:MYXO-CTERM domain-containing protein
MASHAVLALVPALVVGLGSTTAWAEDGIPTPDTPTGILVCPPEGNPLSVYDGEPRVSETIFANYDGAQLSSGQDNAPNNTTEFSPCAGNMPAYGEGSKRTASFQALVAHYAPFAIDVTDSRPGAGTYSMVMATPSSCYSSFGVSPIDCGDRNPNSVAFCFIGENDGFSAAEHGACMAHELGHSFGLEHVDDLGDIMNPLIHPGTMTFKDQCIAITGNQYCSSEHAQHCSSGQQNSYQELMGLFGPGAPDTGPPSVEITYPNDGDTFDEGASFAITVEASDDRGVLKVDLYNDGSLQSSDTTEPWGWGITNIPAGAYSFHAVAMDAAGNETTSNTVSIEVGASGGDDDNGDDGGGDDGGGDDGGGDDSGGDGGGDDPDSLPPGLDEWGEDRDAGCGCTATPASHAVWLFLLVAPPLVGRRRELEP